MGTNTDDLEMKHCLGWVKELLGEETIASLLISVCIHLRKANRCHILLLLTEQARLVQQILSDAILLADTA